MDGRLECLSLFFVARENVKGFVADWMASFFSIWRENVKGLLCWNLVVVYPSPLSEILFGGLFLRGHGNHILREIAHKFDLLLAFLWERDSLNPFSGIYIHFSGRGAIL
jgi:hypothetical protein